MYDLTEILDHFLFEIVDLKIKSDLACCCEMETNSERHLASYIRK